MPGSLGLGHHSWREALVQSSSSGKEYSQEYLSQTVHSSRCRAAYGCSSLARSVLCPIQHIPVSFPLLSYKPGPLKGIALNFFWKSTTEQVNFIKKDFVMTCKCLNP